MESSWGRHLTLAFGLHMQVHNVYVPRHAHSHIKVDVSWLPRGFKASINTWAHAMKQNSQKTSLNTVIPAWQEAVLLYKNLPGKTVYKCRKKWEVVKNMKWKLKITFHHMMLNKLILTSRYSSTMLFKAQHHITFYKVELYSEKGIAGHSKLVHCLSSVYNWWYVQAAWWRTPRPSGSTQDHVSGSCQCHARQHAAGILYWLGTTASVS